MKKFLTLIILLLLAILNLHDVISCASQGGYFCLCEIDF
jgi:hypothetical protein